MTQDLRYALRVLGNQPGLAIVAVVSLALGIGANTVIFSIIDAILLRSLPYPDPERLVMVWFRPPKQPDARAGASVANYLALKERPLPFEHIGALQFGWPVNLATGEEDAAVAERVWGQRFSASLLEVLGVRPLVGRWYTAAEDQFGAEPVVLISNRLWQRRFGGARDILGKTVRMDGKATTIIGVMPPGFALFNEEAEFWIPSSFAPFNIQSRTRYIGVVARLKPNQRLEPVQSEMNVVAAQLAQAYPETNKDWGLRIETLHEARVGWMREPLLTLQGAVAFVLLIACANVAGLLLAQASARQKETAVKAALRAGRWRVARQFLAESLLLSLAGGVLGVGLAYGGIRLFLSIAPEWFVRLREISIDARVLGFTAALSVVTGLLFGAAPALQGSKADLVESLKESARGASAGFIRQRLRSVLVTVEMALALVLLIGAGLMIRSFLRLSGAELGCDPRNVLTFQVRLARGEFVKDAGAIGGFHAVEFSPRVPVILEQIWERLRGVPGVEAAAASMTPPLSGDSMGFNFTIAGRKPPASEKEALSASFFAVSPDYFRVLKVPMVRGRDFTMRDSAAAPWVVIINQTLARRYFPNQDPLGQRLRLETVQDEKPREIVGVVGDIRQSQWQKEPQPQLYVPHVQQPLLHQGRFAEPRLTMTYMVRSAGDPLRLVPALRGAVAEVERNQPVFNIKTVEQYLAEQVQEPRVYMLLLGVFGGIAVALAAIGIYGIMAYAVTLRTHEIGIRMALGAGGRDVLKLVLRHGLLLIGVGTLLGVAASLALTRVLASFVWGITATDPLTFVAVTLVLVGAGLAACYVPARRAVRIDPMVALRYE